MATELAVQSERAFQKQPHIFQNSKVARKSTKVGKGGRRWYKDVGLGFKTPQNAISGNYIGMSGVLLDDDVETGRDGSFDACTRHTTHDTRHTRLWDAFGTRRKTEKTSLSLGGTHSSSPTCRDIEMSRCHARCDPRSVIHSLQHKMMDLGTYCAINMRNTRQKHMLTISFPQTRSAPSSVRSPSVAVS